jgi:hypothetical protein
MKHLWRGTGEGLAIAIFAWLLVFIVHLIWEPYHLQDDAIRNRAELQKRYDKKEWEDATCRFNLNTEEVKTRLLTDRVNSQQGLINSQQGVFNTQQKSFDSQQTTMNTCMSTLGELEKPEPLKIISHSFGVTKNDQANIPALYVEAFLVLTNKTITPIRLLVSCDKKITLASGGILGTGGAMGGDDWSGPKSDTSYGIGLLSPAWTVANPMIARVYFNDENIRTCTFDEH